MSQPIWQHRREIWSSLCLSFDTVSDILWRQALADRQPVGTCGRLIGRETACGLHLHPGQPYTVGRATWYPAECAAGHETTAHGPRPAKPVKGAA